LSYAGSTRIRVAHPGRGRDRADPVFFHRPHPIYPRVRGRSWWHMTYSQ